MGTSIPITNCILVYFNSELGSLLIFEGPKSIVYGLTKVLVLFENVQDEYHK